MDDRAALAVEALKRGEERLHHLHELIPGQCLLPVDEVAEAVAVRHLRDDVEEPVPLLLHGSRGAEAAQVPVAEKRGDFRLKHLPLRIKAEGLQVIEVEDLGEPQVLLPVEHIVFLIVGAVHAAEVNRIPANPVLGIKKKHIILRVIRPGRPGSLRNGTSRPRK